MEDLFKNRTNKYNEEVDEKNNRIQLLENEISKLRGDFNKAFDDKISLERELKVYRDLLEFEENRFNFLNSSPLNFVTLDSRRRFNYSITSGNTVVISQERDDYVAIFNTSAQVCFKI